MSRRLLASVIDGAISVSALGVLFGLFFRRRKDRQRTLERWTEVLRSRRWRWPLNLLGHGYSVSTTLRGSTGYHVAGIRLVDARSGGPISLKQAFIRVAVPPAWGQLVKLVTRGKSERAMERTRQQMREIEPQVEALSVKHAGDPAAKTEATMALYAERDINPFASCRPALVGLLLGLASRAPALWSPLNQGLADRLAGTVVVFDR